jgi:DNA-binding NarL/FixJ family response regulator
VRILLCDDHRLLVEAFATMLTRHGHDVVATAATPEDGFRAVLEHHPDVCILDVYFPEGSGLDLLAKIVSVDRSCKVLMLSGRSDPCLVDAAVRAGAAGFVVKDESIDGILRALRRLESGEALAEPDLPRPGVNGSAASRRMVSKRLQFLTPRERETLLRIAEGENTKQIARAMRVAHTTARTHVQNVLTKLGVRSRLQAAALVAREGLTDELTALLPQPSRAEPELLEVPMTAPVGRSALPTVR